MGQIQNWKSLLVYKKLSDVDTEVLKQMISDSNDSLKKTYPSE